MYKKLLVILLLALMFSPMIGQELIGTNLDEVSTAYAASSFITLAPGSELDMGSGQDGADSITDLDAYSCCSQTALAGINGSGRAYASGSWATASLVDAESKAYNTSTAPSGFIPSIGEVYYIRTGNNKYYKMRMTAASTPSGIPIEWEYLGAGSVITPPDSSWTHTSLDLSARFTDTSTESPNAWLWNFGDSSTSTSRNPYHLYATAGSYNVCLTASNNGGAGDNQCAVIVITEVPSTTYLDEGIDFDGDGTDDLISESVSGCGSGKPNRLRTLSTAQYSWSGDNYYSATLTDAQGSSYGTGAFCGELQDVNSTIYVNTTGNGFAKFWILENTASGMRIQWELLLGALPDPPVSSWTHTSLDLVARFTDTSTETPTSWSWTFGDGNISSSRNPGHQYATAGVYNVCLTASNAGGNTGASCSNITITEVPSTWYPAGTEIDFNADDTTDMRVEGVAGCGTGNPNRFNMINGALYNWSGFNYYTATLANAQAASYGTGAFCGSLQDVNSTIFVNTTGNGYAKFWVLENTASGIRIQWELLETGTLPDPPVNSFTYARNNLQVNFTDTSTNNPTGWSWAFGDAGTSTAENPSHTYAAAGTYNVCLTASNAGGSGAAHCENVEVAQTPNANFTHVATELDVDFTDTSTNVPTSWSWVFGDGAISNAQNPSHTYAGGGTYNACLTAANIAGNDTQCHNVTVIGNPTASFSTSKDGLDVDFTDTSTENPTSWLWDFGDTGTSTLENPNHVYAASGTYNVCLTATNAVGSNQHCENVTVLDYPTASFTRVIQDLQVVFTDTTTENPTSWLWDFGDGSPTSTSQNPLHDYTTNGTYNACVTATNATGNDQYCENVTVAQAPPAASFTYVADGLDVDFTDTSTGLPLSTWLWDFDDTTTTNAASPSHTFAATGVYNVCLTVTNQTGNDQQCENVSVFAYPTASFTYVATELQVVFTDTSTESPTSWLWDYGDGNTGTNQNPTHTFPASGTYTTCLTVTNGTGSDQYCEAITVVRIPTASFTHVDDGLNVDFTDTSSDSPTSWDWEFGDGGTSTLQNPSHAYAASGTYNVCLTATNASGGNQHCENVTVLDYPTASFTYVATELQVVFTDTSTESPTSWLWDYGDGNTGTNQSPTHTFPASGTYTTCLTATNGTGSDQYCEAITVVRIPTASFTHVDDGLDVDFTDTSSDSPTSWDWEFGDGGTSTLQNPSHAYAASGTYNVCLTATNASGGNQHCENVTVLDYPIASFTTSIAEWQVDFTDTSTESPTSWLWDFGNGNSSTQQNPTHTYTINGTYTTCLTATNGTGSDQHCESIIVAQNTPVASFTHVATVLDVDFTDTSSTGSPFDSWLWDFGDTNTSASQNPSHSYAASGTYNVCLTITNDTGNDQHCANVTVLDVPTANFSTSATGLQVTFTDTTSESPTSWDWNFGDGSTSTQQNPVHTYPVSNTYQVCLTAANASGNDQHCTDVTVASAPPNDALTLFDPATSNTDLLGTVLNNPNSLNFINTSPTAPTFWVMGDWNGNGLKTPGYFQSGAFRFTNDLGPTTNWSSGFWLGNPSTLVGVVSGRFASVFANDCIGWVDSGVKPNGDMRFSLKYWCDMTTTPQSIGGVLFAQWLAAPLSDSQGFSGTYRWIYGDWDNDGLDEPAVRRSTRITKSLNAPSEGAAIYGAGSAQRWELRGIGPGGHPADAGLFVAGDWNNDGFDGWGVVYDDNSFYYRNDLSWNPGPNAFIVQTFTTNVGAPRQVDSHSGASGGSGTPQAAGPNEAGATVVTANDGTAIDTTQNVEADLSVSVSGQYAAGEVGLVGDSLVWTITLVNTGTGTANGVQITDTIPSELQIDDVLADLGTITVNGQVIIFNVDSLGVGQTVQFQIMTTVLSQPEGGVFANSVQVRLPDGEGGGTDANLVASDTVDGLDSLPATGYAPKFRW